MKTERILTILLLALAIMVCSASLSEAAPMGTAFTYQGHLYDSNSVADGEYDFQFSLYADPCVGSPIGSDVNKPEVDVIDGYFTVELDFGSDVFDGNAVWLEIGVRPGDMNDPNDYTPLSPWQEVMPTPYAIYAKTAGAGHSLDAADGSPTDAVYVDNNGNVGIGTTNPGQKLEVNGGVWATEFYTPDNVSNYEKYRMNGTIDGYGIGLTSTDDVGFVNTWANAFTWRNFPGYGWVWRTYTGTGLMSLDTTGRLYLKSTAHFDGKVGIGTTSPQNKLDVEGAIAVGSIYSGTTTAPTNGMIIEGNVGIGTNNPGGAKFAVNGVSVLGGIDGSPDASLEIVKSGGTDLLYLSSAANNDGDMFTVKNSGNVGIGTTNPTEMLEVIGTVKATAFVGDGNGLTNLPAGTDGDWTISDSNMYSAVSGNVGIGTTNPAAKLTVNGAILRNSSTIYATSNAINHINLGTLCTTGTFGQNYGYATVSGGYNNTAGMALSTVPGGRDNEANGYCSFAAGRRAKATNVGTFAWADNTDADFTVSGWNAFGVRASGGVSFYTSSDLSTGAYLSAGSGSWSSVSDRNAKENFTAVDNTEILEKLVNIPITTWKYKPETDSVRHIGPMAQDLYAAFGLGDSDKTITSIDADGISFAAIQGLYKLIQEKDVKLVVLQKQFEDLQKEVVELKNIVRMRAE